MPLPKNQSIHPEVKGIPTAISSVVPEVPAQPVFLAQAQPQTQQLILVKVPEGCGPYDLIRVPLTNGQQVDVTIPEGYSEGMTFQVAVGQPHAPLGGGGGFLPPPRPLMGPGAIQNERPNNYVAPGFNMHMRMDKRPVVQPGMEHRTVAIQLTERGCCRPGYYGAYEPGKLNMTQDEFYEAIERYENVLLPCYTFFCCMWPCCINPGRMKRVTDDLNKEYTNRNIRFRIETRMDLVTNLPADLKRDLNAHTEERYFLLITQS